MDEKKSELLLKLTSEIVSSYVHSNPIPKDEVPDFIKSVFSSLGKIDEVPPEPVPELVPAVPVKKSVYPDYIICLEDGKKLKILKRHLNTAYGMTPEQYREKWGLPSNYPMVAPNYAEKRSSLARELGLGRKPAGEKPIAIQPPEEKKATVKRGRKPKTKEEVGSETQEKGA